MRDDEETRTEYDVWSSSTIVTDSMVLDESFVADILDRHGVDTTDYDGARGLFNGLVIGSLLWAVIVLFGFIIFS